MMFSVEKEYVPESVEGFIKKECTQSDIWIIGGTGVISESVFNKLENNNDCYRISGSNRYETNARVFKEFGNILKYDDLTIASGESFPDALSGAAYGAKTSSPLLLVSDDILDSTYNFVNKYKNNKKMCVFGGNSAVNEDVLNKLLYIVETNYNIYKIPNINAIGWTKDGDLITLEKKGVSLDDIGYPLDINYISIFNMKNGEKIDFKDVDVRYVKSISKDSKYVLYEEPKYEPKFGSEEWNRMSDSGELHHYTIKLLDLSTGEVTDFKTKYINIETSYKWISNDKVLVSYMYDKQWKIVDINGEVYESGITDGKSWRGNAKGGDIQDLGQVVKGKVYIQEAYIINSKLFDFTYSIHAIDINTKNREIVRSSANPLGFIAENNAFVIFDFDNNYKFIYTYENIKKEVNVKAAFRMDKSSVSPDGTRVALAEGLRIGKHSVDLLDLKSGALIRLLSCGTIENISWNKEGTAIAVSSETSLYGQKNTYIIKFDK